MIVLIDWIVTIIMILFVFVVYLHASLQFVCVLGSQQPGKKGKKSLDNV